jgi:hypothetical protein
MDMGHSDSRGFDANETARGLRPLGWSELCARLVAAQDLRRIQAEAAQRAARGPDQGLPAGSFHNAAARMLERAGTGQAAGDRNASEGPPGMPPAIASGAEGFINPTYSTYGKGNQGTPVVDSETSLIERQIRQSDENCHD